MFCDSHYVFDHVRIIKKGRAELHRTDIADSPETSLELQDGFLIVDLIAELPYRGGKFVEMALFRQKSASFLRAR